MKSVLSLVFCWFQVTEVTARHHLYWNRDSYVNNEAIASTMKGNRFDELANYLHVNDNANFILPKVHQESEQTIRYKETFFNLILINVIKVCR